MSRKRYRGHPSPLRLNERAGLGKPPRPPASDKVSGPPNYLAKSAQRRLLTLVGMLGLVLILMQQARQPERWQWLWQMNGRKPPAVANGPVLTDLGPSAGEKGSPQSGLGWPRALDPDVLREVRDNSHFRPGEQTAWFTLFRLLQDTSNEELRQQSLGPVSYLQIARQTDAYRGRLVDLTGIIRRVHHIAAPANDLGIADYVQCWLFPDSGRGDPIVLYLLDWPDTLPETTELAVPAHVTGIVYKRWSYLGASGMALAPVVLAKNATLVMPPPTEQSSSPVARPRPLLLLLVTILASALTAALLFRQTAPRNRRSGRVAKLPATLADLSESRGVARPDPADEHGTCLANRPGSAGDERLS
jgi:hypothetical protein